MSRSSKAVQYDVLPTDEDYHPEDFQDLFAFCKDRNEGKNTLTEKSLASMGFFTKNGKLIARLTTAKPDKVAAAKALFGILPSNVNADEAREERLR